MAKMTIKSIINTIKGGATMDFVADFLNKVDVLFSQYAKDGALDNYIKEDEYPEISVGSRDSVYAWAALDGMVHMYNTIMGSHIVFEETVNEELGCSQFTFGEE